MQNLNNGLTQSEKSKNKLQLLAQARLNNKVADLSISCDNTSINMVGGSEANFTYPSSLSYVTNIDSTINPVYTGATEGNTIDFCTEDATFFKDQTILYIPKKILKQLTSRYISKKLLLEIDTNETIAIEKCLIFLNNLCSLFFNPEREYKSLSSDLLHEQLKGENDNTYIYTKVIKLLLTGTKEDGPVIEILSDDNDRHLYGKGIVCKRYKLSETYLKAGVSKYKLKTKYLITRRMNTFYKQLSDAQDNVIAKNLLKLYSKIGIPSTEEIFEEGKRLSKEKATTKKGKLITYRNKRSDDKFKDLKQHSFVEDNIKMFDYLTEDAYMVPFIGTERSGGRVVDSFNLMPSWIRNLVKIDGEEIVEVDMKALHPNLGIKIYGGNERYLTHQKVAEKASIELKEVKVEHLSFFNKEQWQMKQSVLWDYYQTNEPKMMENILEDKYRNGYKATSQKMFKLEVEIMTEVIKRLNTQGICVGYVYDALFCKKSDASIVKEMMDTVVAEFGVYTVASYDGMNNNNEVTLEDVNEEIVQPESPIEVEELDFITRYELANQQGDSDMIEYQKAKEKLAEINNR